MFNQAHVILAGNVASDPYYQTVGNNIPRLSLRVAWTTRRLDPATGEWADGSTSFAKVTCWRKLAENLSMCLRKGDPVLVRGKLEVRQFVGRDGQPKTSVDVEAMTLGHDLSRGVAKFQRLAAPAGKTAQQAAGLPEGENGRYDGTSGFDGASGEIGDETDVAAAIADDELVPATDAVADELIPGADAGADDDMFDDGAIDALTKDADSVAAPF
jgi:single-strand DNA-binding protein